MPPSGLEEGQQNESALENLFDDDDVDMALVGSGANDAPPQHGSKFASKFPR
jgi:hypothetical protein